MKLLQKIRRKVQQLLSDFGHVEYQLRAVDVEFRHRHFFSRKKVQANVDIPKAQSAECWRISVAGAQEGPANQTPRLTVRACASEGLDTPRGTSPIVPGNLNGLTWWP